MSIRLAASRLLIPLVFLAGLVAASPGAPGATPSVIPPALLNDRWPAHWITSPTAPKNDFGVYLFRRDLTLAAPPARFVVHVTADARYRLWVNGHAVSFGPQRGDPQNWRYDTVDLAPWLHAGVNSLAAQVWSYGEDGPYAIMSLRTGFLLQGDSPSEAMANTGAEWRVTRDEAYQPLPLDRARLRTFIVVGPGESFDAAKHSWGWADADFDARAWAPARVLNAGAPHGWGTDVFWWLKPRSIPPLEATPQRLLRVRRAVGVAVDDGFLTGHTPVTIPAHTKASVLIDQGFETNTFPQLTVSGGKDSKVRLTYAEALVDAQGHKGNRNEVEGREIVGVADEFRPDGGQHRLFAPLDFRTYRYVELAVETAAEPLVIADLHGVFTGYPFVERGAFSSDDPSLAQIWNVGWRTARLCALETYVDCPYYEQLQYIGDTRIQSLISLYVSGDDRLMRNAIELFDQSRLPEGLTQSRYPSASPQVINTFSLFWIDMIHDYWRHREDDAFLQARLPGVESVLGWFERKVDPATGLLGPLPYWTFVDWTNAWPWDERLGYGGTPAGAREGGSAIVSLQLALTLQHAAELSQALQRPDLATRYTALATSLGRAVQQQCWDPTRQLFADTPAKTVFSQHANILAVLAGASEGVAATDLITRVAQDTSLIQASTYFRFYLLRAMKAAGRGDDYLSQLGPWREMLAKGLTTFAEQPDPTRSDCHAWSASPVYELLATVCGIEPGAPGFARVRIEPHLGPLPRASGRVAHPRGMIEVSITRVGSGVTADVTLPPDVAGEFIWRGHSIALRGGTQTIHVP